LERNKYVVDLADGVYACQIFLPSRHEFFCGRLNLEECGLSAKTKPEKRWLKAELHAHCNLDPSDYRVCRHTPEQLISKAAELNFQVLAITCHNIDIWTEDLSDYAQSLGITLIPGMEVSAEGTRHTLVYNFHTGAENLNTLEKIRARSREDTLVIAPHPYFPGRSCLRSLLERNLGIFDAIERSGFQVPGINFNRRGLKLSAKTQKPVVGNGDVHYLWQLGRTFTWIYAEPHVDSIVSAIRRGMVRVEQSNLSWFLVANFWAKTIWRYAFPVNAPPVKRPLDKIEDGRCLGATEQGM
jgi:predicted metal-dependent phosphoesterase TrpH